MTGEEEACDGPGGAGRVRAGERRRPRLPRADVRRLDADDWDMVDGEIRVPVEREVRD